MPSVRPRDGVLAEQRRAYFGTVVTVTPARRASQPEDVAAAVVHPGQRRLCRRQGAGVRRRAEPHRRGARRL